MAETSAPPEVEKVPEETPEPVLDLNSIAPERPRIKFNGKLYELALLGDFGIEEQQQLTRDGNEFDRLWGQEDELNQAAKDRLKMLLDRMFEQVFRADEKVKGEVRDDQRKQIVVAFTLAPLAAAAAREREREEAKETPTTES